MRGHAATCRLAGMREGAVAVAGMPAVPLDPSAARALRRASWVVVVPSLQTASPAEVVGSSLVSPGMAAGPAHLVRTAAGFLARSAGQVSAAFWPDGRLHRTPSTLLRGPAPPGRDEAQQAWCRRRLPARRSVGPQRRTLPCGRAALFARWSAGLPLRSHPRPLALGCASSWLEVARALGLVGVEGGLDWVDAAADHRDGDECQRASSAAPLARWPHGG